MSGWRVGALLSILLAVACASQDAPPAPAAELTPSPEEAARTQRTIVAFLECEECTEGQLEALRQLGPAAVPSLVSTLKDGPPSNVRDRQRDTLRQSYRELRAFAQSHPDMDPVTFSEDEYVNRALEKFVVLHQTRAARALGAIGGAEARAALNEALSRPLAPHVEETVKEALAAARP